MLWLFCFVVTVFLCVCVFAGWLTLEQQQSRSQMISVQQSGLIEFTGETTSGLRRDCVGGVGEGVD